MSFFPIFCQSLTSPFTSVCRFLISFNNFVYFSARSSPVGWQLNVTRDARPVVSGAIAGCRVRSHLIVLPQEKSIFRLFCCSHFCDGRLIHSYHEVLEAKLPLSERLFLPTGLLSLPGVSRAQHHQLPYPRSHRYHPRKKHKQRVLQCSGTDDSCCRLKLGPDCACVMSRSVMMMTCTVRVLTGTLRQMHRREGAP